MIQVIQKLWLEKTQTCNICDFIQLKPVTLKRHFDSKYQNFNLTLICYILSFGNMQMTCDICDFF